MRGIRTGELGSSSKDPQRSVEVPAAPESKGGSHWLKQYMGNIIQMVMETISEAFGGNASALF